MATDLFSLYNEKYVLVVDYFSSYVEIAKLRNESAKCVIDNIKKIFSRHGIPKIVVSDNGPQYSSHEFTIFSTKWDFQHVTSRPYFPQSNGLAERNIQTTKRILKKSFENKEDPYLALLSWNTTEISNNKSPTEHMLRTTIPSVICQQLKQPVINYKQEQGFQNQNKNLLHPMEPGTTVQILSENKHEKWKGKGEVYKKLELPRSYDVINEKSNCIQRNRSHLIPTKEEFKINKLLPDEISRGK